MAVESKAREPRRCPHCGSKHLHRSRRRGLRERLVLPLVGVLPYRCEDCDRRFLSRSDPPDDVSHRHPPRQTSSDPPSGQSQIEQQANVTSV